MNIIRCLCIVLVLAVAANASMLHKVRGRAMGSLEASVTGEGRYEFDTIAKQTPLAQGEFQRAWSKGLVVSGVPLRSGKTTDLQFTLTQNGNNFELQAQDEAKDADGNPTKVNVIHLTFEEPAYDERALNLNMNMDFTEAAGTAALQRMEEKKKTGDVHASDKIAWCYLAEIGNYYAEDSKGKREFIGTILAKLASDLCDLAGYTHQSLDDGARFRECTNADKSKFAISHMARMVNVFSQGLTFYAKAGFAPCGTRMFEYSRLLATKKQYCESMEAMLKATPASYSAAACRGDASHPFDADRQAECADSERVGECYLKYREAGECAKADAVYKKFLDVRPSAAYGVEAANLNNCPIAKHLAYVETIPRYCRTPESARNAKTSNNDYCKMKKDNGAACKLPGECLSTQCSAGKCCAATGAAADKDSQCCSGKTLGGKCCAANGELVTKAEMCCQTAGEPGPSGKMRCQCAPAGKVVESKSMCCSNTVTIDKKGTTITKKCA